MSVRRASDPSVRGLAHFNALSGLYHLRTRLLIFNLFYGVCPIHASVY